MNSILNDTTMFLQEAVKNLVSTGKKSLLI